MARVDQKNFGHKIMFGLKKNLKNHFGSLFLFNLISNSNFLGKNQFIKIYNIQNPKWADT